MLKYNDTHPNTKANYEVVLLHGFLESTSMWKDFIKATADRNIRCINIHMPNHLPEEKEPYLNTLPQQAEALYNTLLKTEVSKPIFIGHSLGGYLALAFVEKFPEFASGIALINSTCLPDSNERKIQRTRAINIVGKNPNAFIQMAIKNLFQQASLKQHRTEVDKLILDAKTLKTPAIQASMEAMRDREDRTEVLKNFDKKKLFIYGTNDPLIPIEASLEAIKKSNCPSIALNAGHMAWLEDKENLHKILLQFIIE